MHFDLITVIGLLGGAFYLASHYMRAHGAAARACRCAATCC